jgi:hypothetical protein
VASLIGFPIIGLTQPRRKNLLETANEREWARMLQSRPAWACGPHSRARKGVFAKIRDSVFLAEFSQ